MTSTPSTTTTGRGSDQNALLAALDGVSVSLPIILGSTVILYAQVAPQAMGAGVLAAFLGVALVTWLTAGSARPIAYAARFFEAATLATLVQHMALQLPSYGLENTPAARLGLLCALSALAGLVVGLLWLLRAERFARFIPAPVYTGFANSIGLSILIGQWSSLKTQLNQPSLAVPVALAVLMVLVGALLAKRYRPQWPASAVGLLAGVVAGVIASQANTPLPRLLESQAWSLPVTLADLSVLWGPVDGRVHWWLELVKGAAILGTLVFLNNVVVGEHLAQKDDRRTARRQDKGLQSLALAASGALGSPAISGSLSVASIAARHRPLGRATLSLMALLLVILYASPVLTLIPMAALSGLLLVEAWQLWDRTSATHLWQLLRRQPVASHYREDLLVIAGVMATALLINMVAALLVGLLLGLVLHAHRNTQKPVRRTLTGLQLQSNCARNPMEFDVLAQHGAGIRVLQLDSHQFFVSAALLQDMVRSAFDGAHCIVMDWTAVRQIDSSLAQSVGRLQEQARHKGITLLHAGMQWQGSNVQPLLSHHVVPTHIYPDLDRALETAENLVLQKYLPPFELQDAQGHLLWPAHLNDAESEALKQMMTLHAFEPGQALVREGDCSDALWFITRGQASVQLTADNGAAIRVSGVRVGTTIGQIGFIDRQVRSATVVAETTVQAMRLSHAGFQELSVEHPALVQKLLAQITIDLASHLRAANLHALAQAHQVMA